MRASEIKLNKPTTDMDDAVRKDYIGENNDLLTTAKTPVGALNEIYLDAKGYVDGANTTIGVATNSMELKGITKRNVATDDYIEVVHDVDSLGMRIAQGSVLIEDYADGDISIDKWDMDTADSTQFAHDDTKVEFTVDGKMKLKEGITEGLSITDRNSIPVSAYSEVKQIQVTDNSSEATTVVTYHDFIDKGQLGAGKLSSITIDLNDITGRITII